MKNILGIIASPRKSGNCEIMVKEVSRHVDQPHQLNLLRLADLKILPCQGCYRCLFKSCMLKDDFSVLTEALLAADAFIVAAPTYFLSANALLKLALDRSMALHAHLERMWAKPSVGIAIAGLKGKEGQALLDVQKFLKLMLTDTKAGAVVYGALPGEVFMDDGNKAVAADLGRRLFASETEAPEAPCCPLCGGDTFRFIDASRVRCMLCSNVGLWDGQNGRIEFRIEKSESDFFLTKAGAIAHQNWLRGMKSHFIENKDRLAGIVKDYQQEGIWIKPSKPGDNGES